MASAGIFLPFPLVCSDYNQKIHDMKENFVPESEKWSKFHPSPPEGNK